jgi:hypothetical protein
MCVCQRDGGGGGGRERTRGEERGNGRKDSIRIHAYTHARIHAYTHTREGSIRLEQHTRKGSRHLKLYTPDAKPATNCNWEQA